MPKLTQASVANRQAQVLAVFSRIQEGLTVTAACRQVGIQPKVYRRWIEQALEPLREEAENERKTIVATLTGARREYVQKLIAMATADEVSIETSDTDGQPMTVRKAIYDRDRLAAIAAIEGLLDKLQAGDRSLGHDEAAEFLEKSKGWLEGPRTMIQINIDGALKAQAEEPQDIVEGNITEVQESEALPMKSLADQKAEPVPARIKPSLKDETEADAYERRARARSRSLGEPPQRHPARG